MLTNANYSSFWHANGGLSSQATAQAGGRVCRCGRQCICPAGQPCRCGAGCTCRGLAPQVPVATRADLWAEAGETEFGGYRGAWRAPYRGSGSNRSYAGPSARERWLRSRAQDLYQRRLSLQNLWQRRRSLNQYFAGRFGWGRHIGRVAGAIGCPTCAPGSQRFMFALARWQQRNGLRPTGVMTPSLWWRLRRRLSRGAGPAGPGADTWPVPPQDGEPPPTPQALPQADDDAAVPLPADDSAANAVPNGGTAGEPSELGVGFRGRRLQYVQPAYQRA